jgi:hypothetical protein
MIGTAIPVGGGTLTRPVPEMLVDTCFNHGRTNRPDSDLRPLPGSGQEAKVADRTTRDECNDHRPGLPSGVSKAITDLFRQVRAVFVPGAVDQICNRPLQRG